MYVAWLAITVAIYLLVCAYYLRHRACSWFHPLTVYLAFHGLVFVLRPILSWSYGYTMIYHLFEFSPDDYAKNMALVVANLGLLCFAAASLTWGDASFEVKFDRFSAIELDALRRPLWVLCIVLVPLIGFSIYGAWGLRASALATLELDQATGTTINTVGNGYIQFAYILAVTLMPLLAWAGRFRIWSLLPTALFVFLLSGSGVRGPIISMLVCFVSLYLYAIRRRTPDWRVFAAMLLGALLFNYVGADRGQRVRTLVTGEAATAMADPQQLAPLEGMDLANLEFVEFLVDKVPRETGSYEYFVDNLQVFTEPIPRVLWKQKPVGQPIRLFYLFDYGYPIGMTRSMPGEGWTQLGLLGVALWCGLWGGICGWIYNRYARGPQTALQTACYAAFMATLIVFYRDGLLITLLRQGLFFFLPPLLWMLLARTMGVPRAEDLRRLASIRDAGRDPATGRKDRVAPTDEPPQLPPRSRRHPRVSAVPPRG